MRGEVSKLMYIICVVLDMCRVIILIYDYIAATIFKSRYGVLELIKPRTRIVILPSSSLLCDIKSGTTVVTTCIIAYAPNKKNNKPTQQNSNHIINLLAMTIRAACG